MAIYHFTGTVISRSAGKSAIASAAYRAGEKLYDERQERTMDYSKKQDVAYKEIVLPEGAPEWMGDREKLWNAVERAENRKDAQLAREVHFSLPREFTKEQNIELAKEFVQNEFVERGMVADLCVHDGKAKDGEEQPHAHVMLTMREITEKGFGLKERSWNAKENMLLWRESWAEHVNKHLALNGIEQRVDHRSYEERGIDLVPQNKIGPVNLGMHEQKVLEHQNIARENGNKLLEDPSIALKLITHHQSTFTHQDLARLVNRNTIDAEQFKLVYEKIKASDQIIVLGKDELGRERLTTKEMLGIEQKMLSDAVVLEKRGSGIAIGSRELDFGTRWVKNEGAGEKEDFISERDGGITGSIVLSSQQQEALEHIIGDGDIKCLIGYAGTGKSCLLDRAREVWEREGYKTHGITLSGIAAENLEFSSGIESRTFASRKYYWDKGEEKLDKKDILVIDEAGMLGSRQIAKILEEVREGGAKAVLLGDPQQLQAIEAGAAFRAISEQTGYLELTEIRRQQEPWQQEATKEFALKHTKKALELYEQNECVHLYETQAVAKEALVKMWNEGRIASPDKSQIMLSYTRRDVGELNEMARDYRKEAGELGAEHKLEVSGGIKEFAVGERIYFLQNNRSMEVKNGTLGTIENIEGLQVTVRLDDKTEKTSQKTVAFSLDQYNHITHGYAATIHKAQGVTVDQSFILASKHLDSHAAYVGMTRHKERADLFWSKEEFANKKELEQSLGRDRSKDVTLDYTDRDKGYDGVVKGHDQERMQDSAALGGSVWEQDNEKAAAEVAKELAVLGKNHEESSTQKHVRELRELTQKSELQKQEYYQEIKEDLKGNKAVDELAELKAFQERFESEHPELVAKAQEEIDGYKFLQESREKAVGREGGDYKALLEGMEYNGLDRDTLALKNFEKEFEQAYPKEAEIAREEIEPLTPAQERRAEKLIDSYHRFEDRYHALEERGGSRFSMTEAKDQMARCAYEICHSQHAMEYLQKNDMEFFQEMNRTKELEKTLEMERGFDLSL